MPDFGFAGGSSSLAEFMSVVFSNFFFQQKTAYDISLGLVGSEMCIRDSTTSVWQVRGVLLWLVALSEAAIRHQSPPPSSCAVLYMYLSLIHI